MENQIQRVEVEPAGAALLPLSMRARIFVGAFGLACLGLSALLLIALLVFAIESSDWGLALGALGMAVALFAGRSFGKHHLRMALTGVDPQAEARALDETASRAMLNAVERTGPAD